ncbi:MAG: arylsulfatase [Dehalococcoidia bacterium]|nr:arylsulfatase [Dehalococcoidia bacterium]
MRTTIGLIALLVVTGGCASTSPEPTSVSGPPNIVFILADDMGYGDPGCFNPESKVATPHIDRLARQGMRFTDAHAPGAYCIPSRYGLITGRYPMRTKFAVRRRASIAKGQPTIASVLKRRGYGTSMVGKWHLGFDGGPDFDWSQAMGGGPVDVGFDSYFGIPASLDIPPYYYIRDRHPVAPPTGRIAARNTPGWTNIQGEFWREGGLADGFVHREVMPRFTSEATAYIDRQAAKADRTPFFLYVALAAPHTPWLPVKEFAGKSDVDLYGDFVMQTDATVGKILAALDRNDLAKDTLVIFTSDNGPVWYPQDVKKFGHRSVAHLRGMKSDSWEGGHRMPFVARWPGRVAAGSSCNQTICFTDMLATFAAIVGEPLPAASVTDSVSVLPLLDGADRPVRDVTVLRLAASVIRQGRWKLINHLGSGGFSKPRRIKPSPGGPTGQLYDLEADPGETTNLWSKEPAIVAKLKTLLDDARTAAKRRP